MTYMAFENLKGGKMTTLKQKRVDCGMTQKAVAKQAGISERQYIRIENGERLTNILTAYRIARCFNSTIDDCFRDYFTSN